MKNHLNPEHLEDYLVKVGDWWIYPQAGAVAAQISDTYGGNVSVGVYPVDNLGQFVLLDQGEGIQIVWTERDGYIGEDEQPCSDS